ncbi:multiple monosaccharide ABC transporter permease [Microbacterium ulmi]|uniref:Xylose transport system permease protein XylH n=1 Tax=Microbacterium ulmi TaxID=179095 RepID=A0A7Y2M1F1_9MICO|nr:multiple monosaccharide ABC transporter permease [Microbacterium ulmi]NII69359.1 putative multiple sugar transport system permease protein [Microbacterium ulmi]NNH04029.1 sugar ABC transporter permease [Microbacterium ulmi]
MSKFSTALREFTGGRGVSQFSMIIALAVIIVVFQIWTDGLTLAPTNVINVVQQYSYILILAVGMVMVIIAGHIDLSVGSIAAFVGIVVAQSMASWQWPAWAAMLLGLGIGALAGAWQGFWVAYVGVPAFIVTLAGMLIFRGANQIVGNSTATPTPASFNWIGDGFLPEVGPDTGYNNPTLVLGGLVVLAIVLQELGGRRRRKRMGADPQPVWISVTKVAALAALTIYATLLFAGGRPGTSFPVVGIIAGILIVLYTFVTRRTVFGRQIYAVGGNSNAAVLSGVNARRVNFLVMMNMSVLAAVAGMVFVGYSNASGPSDGTGWELDAIAAVFVGGAAIFGGVGTVPASIIGAFVMAFLANGLSLLGIDTNIVSIIRGLVLLLAVAFDVYNKTQGRPSLTGLILDGLRRKSSSPTEEQIAMTEQLDARPEREKLPLS